MLKSRIITAKYSTNCHQKFQYDYHNISKSKSQDILNNQQVRNHLGSI